MSSASTKEWEQIKKEGKDSEIMKQSAALLKTELDILNPKRVIFVGGQAKLHFNRHYKPLYDAPPCYEVKHYSFRAKTTPKIEAYYKGFQQLRDKIKAGALG